MLVRMVLIGAACLAAVPALAQSAGTVAGDVAITPAEDVGFRKKQIPPVLAAAQAGPYARGRTESCGALTAALGELTAVLGPDYDTPRPRRRGVATRVAKGVVGGLIPFRGVVREISGAAGAERNYQAAVDAGLARRGYLNGIYETRNCAGGGQVARRRK